MSNSPFDFDYYNKLNRSIREEKGKKIIWPLLQDMMLYHTLEALNIVNIKAKEFNCDLIVNLGDTFGSTRFFNGGFNKERADLFLNKHNGFIKEVFYDHIIISGNNDPFILPDKLQNIFTFISKPTVMFDKYLFMPMSWEEGGSKRSKEALKFQIENPDQVEIVFAHDCADFRRFDLSNYIQAKKVFYGHTHKRNIPKKANSKNVCVGAFFLYYTGFITYDDKTCHLQVYNAQGKEVNQTEEIGRYKAELQCNEELAENEKLKVLNSYSKREKTKLVNSISEKEKELIYNRIIEYRNQLNCTGVLTKEQLDQLLERQILLTHYIREYRYSLRRKWFEQAMSNASIPYGMDHI
jgi:predicted phosphodiesterase